MAMGRAAEAKVAPLDLNIIDVSGSRGSLLGSFSMCLGLNFSSSLRCLALLALLALEAVICSP